MLSVYRIGDGQGVRCPGSGERRQDTWADMAVAEAVFGMLLNAILLFRPSPASLSILQHLREPLLIYTLYP